MNPGNFIFFSKPFKKAVLKVLGMSASQICHLYAFIWKEPVDLQLRTCVHFRNGNKNRNKLNSHRNTAKAQNLHNKGILVHFLQWMFFSNTQDSTTLSVPLGASLEAPFPWKRVVANREKQDQHKPKGSQTAPGSEGRAAQWAPHTDNQFLVRMSARISALFILKL